MTLSMKARPSPSPHSLPLLVQTKQGRLAITLATHIAESCAITHYFAQLQNLENTLSHKAAQLNTEVHYLTQLHNPIQRCTTLQSCTTPNTEVYYLTQLHNPIQRCTISHSCTTQYRGALSHTAAQPNTEVHHFTQLHNPQYRGALTYKAAQPNTESCTIQHITSHSCTTKHRELN